MGLTNKSVDMACFSPAGFGVITIHQTSQAKNIPRQPLTTEMYSYY